MKVIFMSEFVFVLICLLKLCLLGVCIHPASSMIYLAVRAVVDPQLLTIVEYDFSIWKSFFLLSREFSF